MSKTIKVALAGAGAFGIKHLDGIKNIDGVEVVSLIGREFDKTKEVADKYGIAHVTTNLADSLALPEVDAVILCTPTQMHASQSIACLKAGKHVQVEIPLADSWKDAEEVVRLSKESGKVAMCGHTRRFNPSHQWVNKKIKAGEFNIQQMDVQTYFFRRTNMNALGQARSWTDHLLWHHAAHTVDLFAYQAGSPHCQSQCGARSYSPKPWHCHGHEHSIAGSQRCYLYFEFVLQQRRSTGHLFPLHRRHRYIPCALRRFVHRQRRAN